MYKQRRHALATLLPENSIALFFSGKAPYKVGDEKYPFSVDRSFYYLSGLDKENMILAIIRTQGKIKEQLFLEHYDEEQAKWVGGKLLPEEAADISEIEEVTRQGILAMMDHVCSGMMENQVEAWFDFVLKTNGCSHSFPSIIASGRNATVLHYDENNQKIKKNSLLLCDLGASCHYMNADITRTFPASGSFTKRQKEIYNIVLEANQTIMSLVHPGITLKELNQELIHFYEERLKPLGLLKRGKRVEDYYWHGVSHMLGLETHDVSLSGYKLRPGNVFTIEPGLYLEDEGIGIRIEDNVLVTEDGCINLSSSIIKDPDEIEAYMQENNIHLTNNRQKSPILRR